MKIDKAPNGAPQLTVSADDKFGPAVARHLAVLSDSAGDGNVAAHLRQLAGRMASWRATEEERGVREVTLASAASFADANETEPEPEPDAAPIPEPSEPEPEPDDLPFAARARRRARR